MSTLEKLFMHVFDRRQWIGEQLRQQIDSYEESLACNLAARGRQLPTWLFEDGPESRSDAPMPDNSNRTELNQKKIITDLLFPSSRVTTPATRNTCFPISSYKATRSFQDGQLTGACFSGNHIQCLQINEEIPSTSLEKCNEGQSQIQPDMTDIGTFSTIQRSRSRQKDIEKRSSVKKAPVDTTTSIRQAGNTRDKTGTTTTTSNQCRMGDGKERKLGEAEILACQTMNPDLTETLSCVETGIVSKGLAFDVALTVSRDNLDSVTEKHNETMNRRSHFHLEKDLSAHVGETCRIGDGEKRKEVDMLKSSTSHLIKPVSTETMNSVETGAFEPKRLVFNLALASFDNNLESVVENQDESRDGSPGSALESKPSYPNGKSSGMRDSEEKKKLVKMLSPQVNDAVKLKIPTFDESRDGPGTVSAEGFPSPKRLGQSGPRETEAVIHAHNSLLPDGVRDDEERNEEIAGLVNGSAPEIMNTELNESPHCMDNDEVQDTCSPTIEGSQQMIKPSVGEGSNVGEVEAAFYARDSYSPIGDVTRCNNEATERDGPVISQMDISELRTELDQSLSKKEMELENLPLSQPMEVVGEVVLDVSDKRKHSLTSRFHEASRQNGEGSLVKSGEGIKHLSSGGRYYLRSSAKQEKNNASVLRDGILPIGGLKDSWEVEFHADVNSWPKRRKMEVFSNFSVATSPRPRKRPVLPKTSYCPMEEDESETSLLVLEEHNRIPSMSSSSADNRKASTEPNIGSPIFDANHFSISPKEGDVANTFKYVPEINALSPVEDDLANGSKNVHEIDVGTSSKYDGGSCIDQEDTRPELEAFTMAVSSDSESEIRNLATPNSCFSTKYKLDTLPDVYKLLPTGHLNFMKTDEALSVPVNDRKQLSASVTSVPCQSGPLGYPGLEAGLSTSGKSGRGRPPLTPPAQKFSYRRLSEINETGNVSGNGSGIRSSGKTPLHPDLTCFRIDEDAAEDDVPNDNDAVDPQDLSAVLEESALQSVNDSQNLLDGDGPNYRNTLQDITSVLKNTEAGAAIPVNFPEGGGFTGKKPKQSAASLNKRELGRKASGSMRSGLATVEAIWKGQEKSMATVSSKPSNIVSDVTSFVPLVKKKQQPVAKKRDVRIPALEAAEANKRLEEKKRTERELQKAAMKAEREKLNQEKALKKKQEEEQKKKEADMATKKRQREDREKKEKEKEKEKKRKCTEIDRQTQREEPTKKEPPKRARVAREEKELQHNVIDEKEQSKKDECGKQDAFVRPGETGASIIIVDDSIEVPELPRVVEKSYEMSPYKDSDAEGDDDLDEVEEDKIRRKKDIPSWARKEFLEDYLQSKKYLNPEMIFSCKCSFDMNNVLKPRNQKQHS